MKQNKLLGTAYSLLAITTGLSSVNVALAEDTEVLQTINVSTDIEKQIILKRRQLKSSDKN